VTNEDKENLQEVVTDARSKASGSGRGTSMDDQINRAIRIGEDNAVIIQLYQNFCANLQVERFGGTGIVEIETGLPIGSRSFKCQHASAGG
jgi:hypothetical protein